MSRFLGRTRDLRPRASMVEAPCRHLVATSMGLGGSVSGEDQLCIGMGRYGGFSNGREAISGSLLRRDGGRRHLAITDTLMGMAEKGLAGGKEKQFAKMLEMMTSSTKWSLKPWKTTMDAQLDSWMMYVPGVSSSDEVQEIKGFKVLLDAMTDAELENPDLIDQAARTRIAAKAGKTPDDVTRMLFFYKQSLIICTWLQTKKKAGEALPETEQELQEMQASDGRLGTIAKKVMNPKGRRSGRGRRLPF
jgi:hypothetical protein